MPPPLEKNNIKKKFGGRSYIKYYIIFPIKCFDRKYILDPILSIVKCISIARSIVIIVDVSFENRDLNFYFKFYHTSLSNIYGIFDRIIVVTFFTYCFYDVWNSIMYV